MTRWNTGLFFALASACASTPPDTHYYQLVVAQTRRPPGLAHDLVLGIEAFAVNSAYATERIVYRRSPYRLDYYNYHRWIAEPSLQIAEYLREAYARTGAFARVASGQSGDSTLTLGGRASLRSRRWT